MESSWKENSNEKNAYVRALLRTLRHASVKFLRFQAIDAGNTVRAKAVPVDYLWRIGCICTDDNHQGMPLLEQQVAMAQVVFGGLPTFGDYIQTASGLDASQLVHLIPDMDTLRILPYAPQSASVLCTLQDPVTRQPSDLCCRTLLAKVVREAKLRHNIAFAVGSELEFCLFNDAQTKQQPVDETRFCQTHLLNQQEDFLAKLHDALVALEIPIEQVHAESAPGQVELVLRYCNNPIEMADRLTMARETISSLAISMGMCAVWLPKIFADKAGNGNHLHISLCDASTAASLFAAPSSGNSGTGFPLQRQSADDLHPLARSFIEGILVHLPSLLALTMPTLNSFRRVGPGCWTGSGCQWAFEDKESPLRVAANHKTGTWSRVEYKLVDSTANPYLALAAILTAGMDGIARQANLRPVNDATDAFPSSLVECLDALERNDLFKSQLSPMLLRAYLACRRGEIERAHDRTLQEEVKEALRLV